MCGGLYTSSDEDLLRAQRSLVLIEAPEIAASALIGLEARPVNWNFRHINQRFFLFVT